MKEISLFILDSDQLVIDCIMHYFSENSPNIKILYNSGSLDEIIKKLTEVLPSILFLGISMPEVVGLKQCRSIKKKFPALRIIACGSGDHPDFIAEVFNAGANCYIQKSAGIEALNKAIVEVNRTGYCYLYDMAVLMDNDKRRKLLSGTKGGPLPYFSERELEIAQLARKEHTNKEISHLLGIHEKTVELHKRKLVFKTDSKKFIGALDYLISNHYLPWTDKVS